MDFCVESSLSRLAISWMNCASNLQLLMLSGFYIDILFSMAGETIISIAYGLDVESENDPYIQVAEKGQNGIAAAAIPGAFLVDSFPILKYVPEWMPGAGFQKKAKAWRKAGQTMTEMPFAAAKNCIVRILLC